MDISQLTHELQPHLHRATWLMPALAGYLAGRSAWGARQSSPFVRRTVSGIAIAIILAMPLFSKAVIGVWSTAIVFGLAMSAVGLTRQEIYSRTSEQVSSTRRALSKWFHRGLATSGALMTLVGLVGLGSGGAVVLSMGPSMWPTAAIAPTFEWVNLSAYKLAAPEMGDDIEFTVDWENGAALRADPNHYPGWPSGRYRKRVWAAGGDHVEVLADGLRINGVRVLDCRDKNQTKWIQGSRSWIASRGSWWCFPDYNGDGMHDKDRPLVWGDVNEYQFTGLKFDLKPGELFVMGDNTLQSSDSREFGVIKTSWVDGRHRNPSTPMGKEINDY